MDDTIHELLIIGGGPAGLAAGVYAARDGLSCLLFERGTPGGQMLLSAEVENFPGHAETISGLDLAEQLKGHAARFGLSPRSETVSSLERRGRLLHVATDRGEYRARAAIVATGSSYRPLGVPGEERLRGRGVSYCGSCDGPFFRGRELVVVGGGDAAVEEALFLTRFASRLTLVHRRDRLRASRGLANRLLSHGKISCVWDSVVEEIRGEAAVSGVSIRNVKTGEGSEIGCGGVFIFVGAVPNTAFLNGVLELDEGGYVAIDLTMRSSLDGVFAAGDARRASVRQIASAVGDGVTAAIAAERFIEETGG